MQHKKNDKTDLIIRLLAEEIKKERESQNKSVRILAYEFDLQKSLISRIENGTNEPKIISIWTLCEALGIKTSDLLKRVENALPEDFSLIDN